MAQLSRTFTIIFSYLKGLYSTENLWLIVWNRDGWNYSMGEWKILLAMEEAASEYIHVSNK